MINKYMQEETIICKVRLHNKHYSVRRVYRVHGYCYMIYQGRNVYNGYQFSTYQRAVSSLFYDILKLL